MKKQLKRYFNTFLTLSKSEQRGIIVLSLLILIVIISDQLLPFIVNQPAKNQEKFIAEIKAFQREQQRLADSVFLEKMQAIGNLDSSMANEKIKPFPFNPNGLPTETWMAMGLSEKQVSTIKNYESKGGKFRTKEDVKKIYGISEAEYNVLEPFIEIEDFVENKKPESIPVQKNYPKKPYFEPVELNSADSAQLVRKLKYPSWIASRIIKFRNLLGGFYSPTQLFEVYGIDSLEVVKRLEVTTIDSAKIQKLNLNRADFKELLKHPYISYDLTKSIVNYRQKNGDFNSVQDLKTNQLISDSLFTKLRNYLTTE